MGLRKNGYITTDDGVRPYFECMGAGERLLLIPNGPPFLDQLQLAATRRIVAFDEARLTRELDFEVEDIDAVRRQPTTSPCGRTFSGGSPPVSPRRRSAPYTGGREWARLLPNARLVSVEGAGHMPWIESPDAVLGAVATFLSGEWPSTASGA